MEGGGEGGGGGGSPEGWVGGREEGQAQGEREEEECRSEGLGASIRASLAKAPADRAWRRRGWLMMVKSRLRSCRGAFFSGERGRKLAEGNNDGVFCSGERDWLLAGEGGGCIHFMHGRSRMTMSPRVPTMSARSILDFHQRGREEERERVGKTTSNVLLTRA